MPPKPRRALPVLVRLIWLAIVGGIATALYAVLTWICVAVVGLPIALASLAAYGLAILWSYRGHRCLTFGNRDARAGAGWRFSALMLASYGAAAAIPGIASGWLGASPELSILMVCAAISILNYLVLSRHVFRVPDPKPPAALSAAGPLPG